MSYAPGDRIVVWDRPGNEREATFLEPGAPSDAVTIMDNRVKSGSYDRDVARVRFADGTTGLYLFSRMRPYAATPPLPPLELRCPECGGVGYVRRHIEAGQPQAWQVCAACRATGAADQSGEARPGPGN